MAGIELYAPRLARHRRTWSVAAVVLGAVFTIGGQILGVFPGVAFGLMDTQGSTTSWLGDFYQLVVMFGLTSLMISGWVLFFERRPLSTIGFNEHGLKRFLRGYVVGLGFLLADHRHHLGRRAAIASRAAASSPRRARSRRSLPIGALLLGFIVQGSTEEIVFRGWLMQLIASRHGLVIALIVNAVLFGLAHAGNTEPTKELALGVANIILFGTFIGLYAAREGSLWGVCGWHAAWNWLLGLGFGLEVSGQVLDATPAVRRSDDHGRRALVADRRDIRAGGQRRGHRHPAAGQHLGRDARSCKGHATPEPVASIETPAT